MASHPCSDLCAHLLLRAKPAHPHTTQLPGLICNYLFACLPSPPDPKFLERMPHQICLNIPSTSRGRQQQPYQSRLRKSAEPVQYSQPGNSALLVDNSPRTAHIVSTGIQTRGKLGVSVKVSWEPPSSQRPDITLGGAAERAGTMPRKGWGLGVA